MPVRSDESHPESGAPAQLDTLLVDDMSRADATAAIGTRWAAVSDRVMGGVSRASLTHECHGSRPCLHLSGLVRLDNNGGFVQMTLDLGADGALLDARPYRGVALSVCGNDETYEMRLRTADATRPWQSYRASFVAGPAWHDVFLPFDDFAPHRLDAPLDVSRLKRIGLLGIGRAFQTDLWVARVELRV